MLDDGVGLPAEVDWQTSASLGLRLVNLLSKQLRGVIRLSRETGSTFTLVFPAEG